MDHDGVRTGLSSWWEEGRYGWVETLGSLLYLEVFYILWFRVCMCVCCNSKKVCVCVFFLSH